MTYDGGKPHISGFLPSLLILRQQKKVHIARQYFVIFVVVLFFGKDICICYGVFSVWDDLYSVFEPV